MFSKLMSGITLQPETIPNWLVIVMGMGTVFVGLIAIIIICKIVGLFFKKREATPEVEAVAAPAPVEAQVIPNRQEIIAAVSAVAAEELGTDISAIRVLSFKKI